MMIKQSKKELYRDNCKLKAELDNAIASNVELRLMLDQLNKEVVIVNQIIKDIQK